MDLITIFAVDVGNRKNFAWVGDNRQSGTDGDGLVAAIAEAFATGSRVALGFECPLFIPVPLNWAGIGKARTGEANRSWSAGGGATVTTYGLHEIAWILAQLLRAQSTATQVYFSPEFWLESKQPGLLIWEAFVSGKNKGRDHADDARLAWEEFRRLLKDRKWDEARQICVGNESQSLNLVALAAEWAGWSVNSDDRKNQLLVVKP